MVSDYYVSHREKSAMSPFLVLWMFVKVLGEERGNFDILP